MLYVKRVFFCFGFGLRLSLISFAIALRSRHTTTPKTLDTKSKTLFKQVFNNCCYLDAKRLSVPCLIFISVSKHRFACCFVVVVIVAGFVAAPPFSAPLLSQIVNLNSNNTFELRFDRDIV